MQTESYQIDPKQVAFSFSRAAHNYDRVADLQRMVGMQLLQRTHLISKPPKKILDVGAGTGWLTQLLAQRYVQANVFAVDIAHAMTTFAKQNSSVGQQQIICADAAHLPFPDQSMDLIFSNLMLQWCMDLDQVFSEFRRVLKPQGTLLFTTFGTQTLSELRNSWMQVDNYSHVNNFLDQYAIAASLQRAGFFTSALEVEDFTQHYLELDAIMRGLKTLGAHNITAGRPRGLVGKQRLQQLTAAYENYREPNGLLPVSYEVIYGIAS